KYLAAAKTSEAKSTVGAISRQAVAEYESERTPAQLLATGASSLQDTHVLCTAATPVPTSLSSVKGVKYTPDPATGTDFNNGNSTKGWPCLRFSMAQPIYYQYHYEVGGNYVSAGLPGAPTISAQGFEAAAVGDTDGDGYLSTFARAGEVDALTA